VSLLYIVVNIITIILYTRLYLEFGTRKSEIIGHRLSVSAISKVMTRTPHTCWRIFWRVKSIIYVIIFFHARQTLTVLIMKYTRSLIYLFCRKAKLTAQRLFYTWTGIVVVYDKCIAHLNEGYNIVLNHNILSWCLQYQYAFFRTCT